MSPYTIEFKRRFSAIRISIIILFMVVIGIIAYLVIDKIGNEETTKVNNLTYLISGNDGRGW